MIHEETILEQGAEGYDATTRIAMARRRYKQERGDYARIVWITMNDHDELLKCSQFYHAKEYAVTPLACEVGKFLGIRLLACKDASTADRRLSNLILCGTRFKEV